MAVAEEEVMAAAKCAACARAEAVRGMRRTTTLEEPCRQAAARKPGRLGGRPGWGCEHGMSTACEWERNRYKVWVQVLTCGDHALSLLPKETKKHESRLEGLSILIELTMQHPLPIGMLALSHPGSPRSFSINHCACMDPNMQ
eukprot:1150802-Pelagomonas_calceolata.AAC.6